MIALLRVFDIVPGWVWALITAGALASAAINQTRFSAERADHAESRAAYVGQVAAAEKARADTQEQRRKAKQELEDANETHAREVEAVHQAWAVDRAAGAAVTVRLRDAARATSVLAGQVLADSTASEIRAAAADAAGVLADLREESDQRSGILARALDDAHVAGNACVRVYNEAREALKKN
jgi:outer membrane receptor for monomeric catechols